MSTTRRSAKWMELARTMVLGLVLALGIAAVGGGPGAAWLGFALAAMYAASPHGRCRATAHTRRPGG
jgi:hypothetical protein